MAESDVFLYINAPTCTCTADNNSQITQRPFIIAKCRQGKMKRNEYYCNRERRQAYPEEHRGKADICTKVMSVIDNLYIRQYYGKWRASTNILNSLVTSFDVCTNQQ